MLTISQDANRYLQHFSSEKIPTLHRVIPALEALCTRWEKKLSKPKYTLYHGALERGLVKLNKYYRKLDHTDIYILSLCKSCYFECIPCWLTSMRPVLHPYYKLAYIAEKWGGAKEQAKEIAEGNPDAINWQAHARQVTEDAVRLSAAPAYRNN